MVTVSSNEFSGTDALVVLSGGQDSSTCAFWAQRKFRNVHCITFDYDQRHRREIDAAVNIAKLVNAASHEIVEMGPILKGKSPLTDPSAQLEMYSDFASMDKIIGSRVELTFVPLRNALFLTLAANRAEVLGVNYIITGVCQADNANYPDCRDVFVSSMQNALNMALGRDRLGSSPMNIVTPLMDLSKRESIELALKMGLAYYALAFTHTAYDGQYPPVGKDHATVLRAHGFEEAGIPDPLVVRAAMEGMMALPDSHNYRDLAVIKVIEDSVRTLKEQLNAD